MPIVCIDRPNRKARRVWTAAKLGQVCRYAIRDGATPFEIRAAVEGCILDDAFKRRPEVEPRPRLPRPDEPDRIARWIELLLAWLRTILRKRLPLPPPKLPPP